MSWGQGVQDLAEGHLFLINIQFQALKVQKNLIPYWINTVVYRRENLAGNRKWLQVIDPIRILDPVWAEVLEAMDEMKRGKEANVRRFPTEVFERIPWELLVNRVLKSVVRKWIPIERITEHQLTAETVHLPVRKVLHLS